MSAPLVVLGSVTQGTATTPTTVWISPDGLSQRGEVEEIFNNPSRV